MRWIYNSHTLEKIWWNMVMFFMAIWTLSLLLDVGESKQNAQTNERDDEHKHNDESNTQHSQYYDIWTTVTTTMGFCYNGRYDNSTIGNSSSSSSSTLLLHHLKIRICWAFYSLPSVITAHKIEEPESQRDRERSKKNLLLYLSEILRASVIFHIFMYTDIIYTYVFTLYYHLGCLFFTCQPISSL